VPVLGFEVTPRFDTPWRALLNVIGVALWLIAVVWVVARHRRGHRTAAWEWVGLVINISMAGVYIPLGPLCVLAALGADRHQEGANGRREAPVQGGPQTQ
jgi:hypothetical protein